MVRDFVPQTFQSVQHHPVDIDFLKKKEIALGMEGLWPNYPPDTLKGVALLSTYMDISFFWGDCSFDVSKVTNQFGSL